MLRIIAIVFSVLICTLSSSAQINTERTIQVGRNALYFQDYPLAIQHFNQVIDAKPYLPEPYYLRAIAKYSLDDFSGADADAAKAIEINPFLPDAWEVRAVAMQNLQRYDDAVYFYDRALELLPYNRQMLFNKALAQEAAGHFVGADSTYSKLFSYFPGYDAGYVGRAQLNLHRGDTLAAVADLTKALEINSNSVEALTMRAALNRRSPHAALADMERAVKLRPDLTYLRINRAVARYNIHDYGGALDDFDYVLEQEPLNYTALFNRAMLRAEVRDNDRALLDLNRALQLKPDDVRARANRALILADKRDWESALSDANAIVEAYPQMYAAYALRSQINHDAGNVAKARADYNRAMEIAQTTAPSPDFDPEEAARLSEEASKEETINRFKTLLTISEDAASTEQKFNAEGLRGKSSGRKSAIEPQSIFQLSYYSADETQPSGVYDREIEKLNSARVLPFVVFLTNNLPQVTREADVARHFESIQRLGALINAGKATALDRFARAMDYFTVMDYSSAIADLDALVVMQPDFAPAYLMRAAARYRLRESDRGRVHINADIAALNAEASMVSQQIFADLDLALEYNPRMAVALYNKGVLMMQMGADNDALDAFSAAIAIDPDLGAAYFNRGYILFSQGNSAEAMRDVSRAGQLGIRAAYSMLKAMQQ